MFPTKLFSYRKLTLVAVIYFRNRNKNKNIHLELLTSMELEDSPAKKNKLKKKKTSRPQKCIIHVNKNTQDDTLSAFTEQSWKVRISETQYTLCLVFPLFS